MMDITYNFVCVKVCCWCIGEYAVHLLDGVAIEGDVIQLGEDEVINLYQSILWSSNISAVTKQYALMSITKLSTRFTQGVVKIQEVSFSVNFRNA